MEEVWKDIPGYEGIYEVSNFGQVRSISRIDCTGRHITGRILKQCNTPSGYPKIELCLDGTSKQVLVHRIVGTVFVHNPGNCTQINHKDENRENNHADNIEWCTPKYNINYGNRTQRMAKTMSGENNHRHKLTHKEVEFIRTHYKFRDKEYSSTRLAKRFGVCKETISRIVNRQLWKYEKGDNRNDP